MTLEEIRQLKVGDLVWMLCRDEEPGTAVKCEVTKAVNDYDVIAIKCVDNPKCKGHRPWYGDVCKTKVETYEKAIEKTQDSIDRSEGIIESEKKQIEEKKADLKTLKERLDKAKEEDLVWITNCGEVQQVFAHDHVFRNFIHYATQEEAYEALAKHLERKLFKALEKCGYKFAIPCDKWIVPMLVRADEEDVCRVIYYPSQSYGCVRKQDLFDTLDEAEAELERRKGND